MTKPTQARMRESLPLELAPLVIRKGDPHVSTEGGAFGMGPVVINHGPPPPISEAVLERVRELIAAAREQGPEPQA